MLSVGDGFSMSARLDRLKVFTVESYRSLGRNPEAESQSLTPVFPRILPFVAQAARRPISALLILAALLLATVIIHLSYAGTWLQPTDVLRELLRGPTNDIQNTVVWQLRLPRSLACVCVGASLGVAGASFQSLFKNRLADPYTSGVSSGAAVGGVLSILLGISGLFGGLATMLLAVVGGLLSLWLVYTLARSRGIVIVPTLLLAGVVVGALLSGLTTLMLYLAGQDVNKILQWLLGSMTPMFWQRVLILFIASLIGSVILIAEAKRLNAFAISESTAGHLGINTRRLKAIVLITATAVVSVCVGAVGIIGFVGLVAPHISRRLLGVDWRKSMPGAMLIGPILLLLSDMLAQRVANDIELPVGAVTAIIGAPFLLVLLRKEAGADSYVSSS